MPNHQVNTWLIRGVELVGHGGKSNSELEYVRTKHFPQRANGLANVASRFAFCKGAKIDERISFGRFWLTEQQIDTIIIRKLHMMRPAKIVPCKDRQE